MRHVQRTWHQAFGASSGIRTDFISDPTANAPCSRPSACSQRPCRISSTFAHRGIIPSTGIYSTLAQKTSLQQASCPNPTFSKMQRPPLQITQFRRILEGDPEGRGRGSRGGRRWGRLGEVRNAAGLGATRHRIARSTRSRRNGPNPLRISTLSASFQS